MSDVTITTSSFLPSSSAVYQDITAGATLTRGQPYYLDSTDSYKAKGADADVQATARVVGIAATDIASGQRGKGVVRDPALIIGGTLTVGRPYFASTNPGGICLEADLSTGDYTTCLGLAISTTALNFAPIISDVARS